MYKPKYVKKVLVSSKQAKAGITKAANWINKRYSHCEKRPILLGILKGAVPFYAELTMQLNFDFEFEFMTLSSFRGNMHAVNKPKILTDLVGDVKGRDIIVVEDVIDSARTLSVLRDYLKLRKPKSLRFVVLADKVDLRVVPFEADYVCFKFKGDPFLVGYGLDIKEIARNLPYIAEFDKKYLNKL